MLKKSASELPPDKYFYHLKIVSPTAASQIAGVLCLSFSITANGG
jgi:hypothetical protein